MLPKVPLNVRGTGNCLRLQVKQPWIGTSISNLLIFQLNKISGLVFKAQKTIRVPVTVTRLRAKSHRHNPPNPNGRRYLLVPGEYCTIPIFPILKYLLTFSFLFLLCQNSYDRIAEREFLEEVEIVPLSLSRKFCFD